MAAAPQAAEAVAQAGLTIQRLPLETLRQDPANARAHDRRNLDAIKASLQRFGQRLPLVVRRGQIVGGNATAQAMTELGWTQADVTLADDLTEADATALAIALNRTAELADWDFPTLLGHLQAVELAGTGFTPEELAQLEALDRPQLTPEQEWQGMPEFAADDLKGAMLLYVHFRTEQDAEEFYRLIGRPMQTARKAQLWWPEPDGHVGEPTKARYVHIDGQLALPMEGVGEG